MTAVSSTISSVGHRPINPPTVMNSAISISGTARKPANSHMRFYPFRGTHFVSPDRGAVDLHPARSYIGQRCGRTATPRKEDPMNSPLLQLLVLAGIAIFLILRLRSVLGTRDGFEKPPAQVPERGRRNRARARGDRGRPGS